MEAAWAAVQQRLFIGGFGFRVEGLGFRVGIPGLYGVIV